MPNYRQDRLRVVSAQTMHAGTQYRLRDPGGGRACHRCRVLCL